jgi:bacteriocin resistance YdeI/OmpD-like protein/uncharacterized protein DUF1905
MHFTSFPRFIYAACWQQVTIRANEVSMASKTFRTTIVRDGLTCFIPLTFDPKPVFGKVRAPVTVTLNGYTYRSTIAAMGGPPCIPLRRSNREAAGLEGGETLDVRLDLDEAPREVEPPADLVKALQAAPPAWDRWQALSFSHQREYVEWIDQAKKADTRVRRLADAAQRICRLPPKRRKPGRWS